MERGIRPYRDGDADVCGAPDGGGEGVDGGGGFGANGDRLKVLGEMRDSVGVRAGRRRV